jgi:hypothetical protein
MLLRFARLIRLVMIDLVCVRVKESRRIFMELLLFLAEPELSNQAMKFPLRDHKVLVTSCLDNAPVLDQTNVVNFGKESDGVADKDSSLVFEEALGTYDAFKNVAGHVRIDGAQRVIAASTKTNVKSTLFNQATFSQTYRR